MINWIIIIIIVLVAFLIIRTLFSRHARHRLVTTIVILVIVFLIGTFYFVTYKNNIDITSVNGFMTGAKVYGIWLVGAFGNVKALTGDAISMDWASVNVSTNNTAAGAASAGVNNTQLSTSASSAKVVSDNGVQTPPTPTAPSSASSADKPMVKPIIFNSS